MDTFAGRENDRAPRKPRDGLRVPMHPAARGVKPRDAQSCDSMGNRPRNQISILRAADTSGSASNSVVVPSAAV